jgi:hypothetical protein
MGPLGERLRLLWLFQLTEKFAILIPMTQRGPVSVGIPIRKKGGGMRQGIRKLKGIRLLCRKESFSRPDIWPGLCRR